MHPVKKSKPTGIILLLIAVVTVMGFMWTGESPFDERIVTVRYLLFALSAFVSFSTPYLLFPDSLTPILQLGNVKGRDFLFYILGKVFSFYWPVYLLIAVLLFGDVHSPFNFLFEKIIYFFVAGTLLTGLLLISVRRYIKSGPDSQFWKESERGRQMRIKAADYFKFPLDPGSIPSLINTIVVLLAGALSVVAASALGNLLGTVYELIAGFLLLLWGLVTVYNFRNKFEQTFYSSNAFFREFFRTNLKGEEAESKREVHQLWWVPGTLKPHVWQYLVQLDRKIPSGRIVMAGHALIWFMAYQRPDQEFLLILWAGFALLHHLLIIMTFKDELSPPWLLNWLSNPATWLFARFWMQIRWIIPLVLSMNLQLFIFGTPEYADQFFVIIVFVTAGLGISLIGFQKLKNEFNDY